MAITWNTGAAAMRFRLKKNKKIKLKKLVRKLNKENEPPGGWKPKDRVQASSIRVTPTGISLISCKDPKPQARKRSSLTRSQA